MKSARPALSACFSCKINKGLFFMRNNQHPTKGLKLQDISVSLPLDYEGDHCNILSEKLAFFLPIQQMFLNAHYNTRLCSRHHEYNCIQEGMAPILSLAYVCLFVCFSFSNLASYML